MLTICSRGGKWVKQGYEASNVRGILYPEPLLLIIISEGGHCQLKWDLCHEAAHMAGEEASSIESKSCLYHCMQ